MNEFNVYVFSICCTVTMAYVKRIWQWTPGCDVSPESPLSFLHLDSLHKPAPLQRPRPHLYRFPPRHLTSYHLSRLPTSLLLHFLRLNDP